MPRHQFGENPGEEPGIELIADEEQRSKSPSWDEQEAEIADLVARSNAGDSGATSELLEKFEVYLKRWETLLIYRRFSLEATDIREFFCLYIRNRNVTRMLRSMNLNRQVMGEVWRISGELHYLVTTMMEREDVWQLIISVFLHCLRRYRPMEKEGKTIPFFRYLYYRFRLELKSELTKLTMDPVFSYGFYELNQEGGQGETQKPTREYSYDQNFFEFQNDIQEGWVSGTDATFPFDRLDPHERQVIKWHYRDGLRRKDIAEFMGCSRVLISNIIKGACEKLQEAMGITLEEWEDWEAEEKD